MDSKFERIERIKEFLRNHSHLSSCDAASEIESIGIFVSSRMIAKYRVMYNIPFARSSPIADKIKADFDAGIRFKSSSEMAKHYKCSPSHAKKILRDLKGIKPQKRKPEPKPQVVITSPPVLVNTMEHAVHQLLRCVA